MFGPGLITAIGQYQEQQVLSLLPIRHVLGDHHRKQRKMLNPVFSASHLRNLTPVFYEITNKVRCIVSPRRKQLTVRHR